MLKVEQVLAMCDNTNAEVSLMRNNTSYARDDARWGARISVERREDGRCDEITVKRSAADGGTALIAAWMAFEALAREGLRLQVLAQEPDYAQVQTRSKFGEPFAAPDDDIPF